MKKRSSGGRPDCPRWLAALVEAAAQIVALPRAGDILGAALHAVGPESTEAELPARVTVVLLPAVWDSPIGRYVVSLTGTSGTRWTSARCALLGQLALRRRV